MRGKPNIIDLHIRLDAQHHALIQSTDFAMQRFLYEAMLVDQKLLSIAHAVLAQHLNTSPQSVSAWGKARILPSDRIDAIAKILQDRARVRDMTSMFCQTLRGAPLPKSVLDEILGNMGDISFGRDLDGTGQLVPAGIWGIPKLPDENKTAKAPAHTQPVPVPEPKKLSSEGFGGSPLQKALFQTMEIMAADGTLSDGLCIDLLSSWKKKGLVG